MGQHCLMPMIFHSVGDHEPRSAPVPSRLPPPTPASNDQSAPVHGAHTYHHHSQYHHYDNAMVSSQLAKWLLDNGLVDPDLSTHGLAHWFWAFLFVSLGYVLYLHVDVDLIDAE